MDTISDTDFVRIWESSMTRQQVAEKLGITVTHAGNRAMRLRNAGVMLKKFPRGRPRRATTPDVNGLNCLIESMK